MSLDLDYMPLNYLETYFVDKDTGLPLSAGIVTFYKDQARTELKNIYKLSGTPPNYTYVALPNPCVLNDAGCFVDASGNDIIPYAYPYDDNGNVELYYITVYSNDGHGAPAVLQWTREGQPNIKGVEQVTEEEFKNYIVNGQFKLQNNIPNSGLITAVGTFIAPGGWTYVRSSNNSTDYILFPRFGSSVDIPTSNPRYACQLKCTIPSVGDSFKHFGYFFLDVNKFASSTQKYTLFFSAQSNSGVPLNIDIKLEKYYGTGGSPSATEFITVKSALAISTSYDNYSVQFIFGKNTGKVIGTNDDDHIKINFSLPPNFVYDVSITNVALVEGEFSLTKFPTMTDYEFINGSLFNDYNSNPSYDGMELYLPAVYTTRGLEPSDADIGKVFLCSYTTPRIGELECTGITLDTDSYDSNGIPYKRLQQKLFNFTHNLPTYGTGSEFVWTRLVMGEYLPTNNIILTTNDRAIGTIVTDGSVATGFDFNDVTAGSDTYNFMTSIDSNGKIYVESLAGGPSNAVPDAGTSGFTIGFVRESSVLTPDLTSIIGIEVSDITSLAGTYFLISNTVQDYYVWFQVDGGGSDPAPGGIGILIDLLSIFRIEDVRQIIKDTLAGFYIVNTHTVDASSMTAGSYFNFYNAAGYHYYVWYKINGVGTEPVFSNAKGILININDTDLAFDIAFGTMFVINNFAYSIPDYRGTLPRFWNHGGFRNFDPDKDTRSNFFTPFAGDFVGTLQYTQNLAHSHTFNVDILTKPAAGATQMQVAAGPFVFSTGNTGGNQSNPTNVYFMAVIKF